VRQKKDLHGLVTHDRSNITPWNDAGSSSLARITREQTRCHFDHGTSLTNIGPKARVSLSGIRCHIRMGHS